MYDNRHSDVFLVQVWEKGVWSPSNLCEAYFYYFIKKSSPNFIISLPMCLKAKLQSTGNRTIVRRALSMVLPDFFRIIMSVHFFHRDGTYLDLIGIFVSKAFWLNLTILLLYIGRVL